MMAEDESPKSRGQVSDAEILEALEMGSERMDVPALSTADVAELLPISRQAVKRRLENLAEEERVGMHKAGRNRIWWVAEENSSQGEFDIEKIIEVSDLSDEKLISLVQGQIGTTELPEVFAQEVIESNLTPENVKDKWVIEKLRSDFDYQHIPEEITASIAKERYGFDTSYWGRMKRDGKNAVALFPVIFIIGILVFTANPPAISVPLVTSNQISDAIELVGGFTMLGSIGALIAGIVMWLFGSAGQKYSNVGDPRPWSEYIKSILRI